MSESSPSATVIRFKAAVLIQKWFRSYQARLEAKRRTAWAIYQNLEHSSEASLMNLQNFFNDALNLGSQGISEGGGSRFAQRLQEITDSTRADRELPSRAVYDKIRVERLYSGPHLSFPLTATQIQMIMNHFSSGKRLHPRYLLQLLSETQLLLKKRPNISRVSTSISQQVTVVGDLHGQLEDLMTIFYKNGLPSVKNPYIFNGDFVDRGAYSVEVAALLFACQLVWPTAVFINRGNHEDCVLNNRYGFADEVQSKYHQDSKMIMDLFADVFAWLPIASIIDERIFVAHGGISDQLDLKVLARLNRHHYYSVTEPNTSGTFNKAEWIQLMHLLWSDPRSKPGCFPNAARGGGCCFGPDVTADFLKRNNLSMVIRSHECELDGYLYWHKNTVLTLFSASNYHSESSNRGAYAKINSSGELRLFQFCCGQNSLQPLGRKLLAVEDDALRCLRSKIAGNKTELMDAFSRLDRARTGCLLLGQWCEVLESVLKLSLPWRRLQPQLAQLTVTNRVMYSTTFQRSVVQQSSLSSRNITEPSVLETVYKNKEDLETIFRIMDRDNSGTISFDEFKECLRIFCQATKRKLSEEEILDMARSMDMNKDGKIDFNEFLEAFRIVDYKLSLKSPTG